MKVLVISFTNLANDPRVKRQIRFLKKMQHEVTALGEESPNIEGVRFISSKHGNPFKKIKLPIRALKALLGFYESLYWTHPKIKKCRQKISKHDFDLIIANDIDTLPLAIKARNGAKILFDAHEFSPREFDENIAWNLFYSKYKHYLCKTYIPKSDKMITVSQGIAEKYTEEFGKECEVMINAPHSQSLHPSQSNHLKIRTIYHGCALPGRCIEDLIEIAKHLDPRFIIDIILVPGDASYICKIKSLASNSKNIRFLDPVPVEEIPKLCNQYDIGIFPLRPTNFNYLHALPNKFFEFIQARVGIAIYPLPEMSRIVNRYSLGIVSDSFDPREFAAKLNMLTEKEIQNYKKNADKAAPLFSAEENFKHFQQLVNCQEK